MLKTFLISVQGAPEATERAVKLLDRVFRWRYNVHGVYRLRSSHDITTDIMTIDVLMTANWMDSPFMQYMYPHFQPDGIVRTWYRLMNRESALDDVVASEMIETSGRA